MQSVAEADFFSLLIFSEASCQLPTEGSGKGITKVTFWLLTPSWLHRQVAKVDNSKDVNNGDNWGDDSEDVSSSFVLDVLVES